MLSVDACPQTVAMVTETQSVDFQTLSELVIFKDLVDIAVTDVRFLTLKKKSLHFHLNYKGQESSECKGEDPIKVSYIFPNGDKYEGECSRSPSGVLLRNGAGKHTSAGGVIYTGEFLEDKMHGRGTLLFPSGALYEGEFKDNMYHGTGTYKFPDRCTYRGHFHENRLEGEGTFTDTQGLIWKGEFHNEAAPGLRMQHSI